MRPILTRLSFVLIALALMATTVDAQRARGDRNKLTRVELDEAGTSIATAHDAVRVLRPQWLTPAFGRIASSTMTGDNREVTTIVAYVDGKRQPDAESMKTVRAADVVEIRYLDQNRAVQMHGPGHEMGAIEVTTVNKRK